MSVTQWPIEVADLDSLVLDPHNVRVRAGRGDSLVEKDVADAEGAIAKYMVEAEDLFDLMRDILRDGYLDNEIPVVVRNEDRFIVAEGNRRTTALKVIANPNLLDTKMALRVERLRARYPDHDSPTAIRIMVAPSWEATQPLLARLHTGRSKKAWLREQQAIFYHAQLSDEVTVDDLRVRYPSEASMIPKRIRMGEMRSVIRALKYDDADLRDFVMNSELKMTTFEYAYTPKKIHSALGLEFTKDGLLASKRINAGQRRGLIYLLKRFKDKTLNTRSPELIAKNKEQHEKFAELLCRIVADEPAADQSSTLRDRIVDQEDGHSGSEDGAVGSTNSADGAGAPDGATAGLKSEQIDTSSAGGLSEPPSRSRGRNRGVTKSRLDMNGFEYRGTSGGMRRRFEELKRLDLHDFPNAAHDLLRTVLECAIKEYFRSKGEPLKPKQTIGPCIDALAREFKENAKITTLINSMNRKGKMSAEQYAGTVDSLSASNHEPDHFAESADVHAAWDRIKPILSEIV
ncbi:hypothetical protein [Brevibacterium sp. FAM 24638]|uniref:hypothetical protein n=1 Tax=Brevibacterium sp. FAM 24638 TaxID=3415681 RepID=UPI003C7E53A4